MDPLFSEFSYGYAITEELASGKLGGLTSHPTFPSLKQEGQLGGGYDVQLPRIGAPLFLQFKRSYFMTRVYSLQWSIFHGPYYKMHIIRRKYSIQHELLIHLELSNNDVYYIAPEFYTDDDLTDYYANKTVFDHSALFSPSDIGHLSDNKQHYIAFNYGPIAYFCSDKPRQINRIFGGESFLEYYVSTSKRDRIKVDEHFFENIIVGMLKVLDKSKVDTKKLWESREGFSQDERLADKARFAAFLSRSYFDAELFIVG